MHILENRKKYWIIRNKHSQATMPQITRCSTHTEPNKKMPPRLFKTKQSASCSLGWWLKGITSLLRDEDGAAYDSVLDPISYRHRDDMEIIEVTIIYN